MNGNDQMFYVYQHVRRDDRTVFYVGKGSTNRAYRKINRNRYWHNIVNKHGFIVQIIETKLTEDEALKKEENLIALYKSNGLQLANISNGGTLPPPRTGQPHTEETRRRIGLKSKGHPGFFKGKKLAVETKLRMSEVRRKYRTYENPATMPSKANKNRNLYVSPSGVIYLNSFEASNFENYSPGTIRVWAAKGKNGWSRFKIGEIL